MLRAGEMRAGTKEDGVLVAEEEGGAAVVVGRVGGGSKVNPPVDPPSPDGTGRAGKGRAGGGIDER